jgi:malonyl-CoA decarboxylase
MHASLAVGLVCRPIIGACTDASSIRFIKIDVHILVMRRGLLLLSGQRMVHVNPLLETAVSKFSFFDQDAFLKTIKLGQVTPHADQAVLDFCQQSDRARPIDERRELLQRLSGPRRLYVLQSDDRLVTKLPLALLFVKLHSGPIPDKLDAIFGGDSYMAPGGVCTALFYSVSSPWREVAGLQLGRQLILRTKADLLQTFPTIGTLSTMSPALGFADYLRTRGLDPAFALRLTPNAVVDESLRSQVHALAREYVFEAKQVGINQPLNAMTHFHCSNGAQVYRLNWPADFTAHGLQHSAGLMVNYRYHPGDDVLKERAARYLQSRQVPIWQD